MLTSDPLTITLIMFSSMMVLIIMGAPLAWALLISSVGSAYMLFGQGGMFMLVDSIFGVMNNFLLVALPLFVLMGLVLERSGIADELFDMVHSLAGGLPGGLGVGTVVISAIIAAMAGVSGAATVSLGIIALPAMLKRGYEKKLITGTIMAGGALGFLIPPSIMMIVYAFLAQESVGKLFIAGVVPGLMLAAIFSIYIVIRCLINPSLGPIISESQRVTTKEKIRKLRFLILPVMLVVAVLGSIIAGIASPTEASAIGAGGALLITTFRGRLNWGLLKYTMLTTTRLTGMLIWIALAAIYFGKVYNGLGAGTIVQNFVQTYAFSPNAIIIAMLFSFLVLGMFLDDFAIMFITVPVYLPIVRSLGFDTAWFAVLFILSMQTAYLTPPFGYNIFYMRSVAPPEISITDIYKATIPFVLLQILGIALAFMFPEIILWLPEKLSY